VLECAGSFKQQHDTGKNLKTVVVFPKITASAGNVASPSDVEGGMQHLSLDDGGLSLIPENSPEHSIAFASQTVFERMLASKCQTWSQKKGCITAIGTIKTVLEALEQKLVSGTPLTDSEQNFYDSVSMTSLEEKLAFVKSQQHQQVDDGKLTVGERLMLLQQVGERIDTLKDEKTQAEADGKAKRVQNLTNALSKAEERKASLEKIVGKPPPPLKHEAEIGKLRKDLEPLLQVEEASKGRLLSVKETQALGRKDEIEEQIEQLVEASRGWFEEDSAFQNRVKASEAAWHRKNKQAVVAKKKKPAVAAAPVSSWSTPATRTKAAGGAKTTAAKSKPAKGGSVFAAMMMDSDSD